MQAGRDLRFLSLSMSGCFCLNALVLLVITFPWFTGVHSNISYQFFSNTQFTSMQILSSRYGLQGCWFSLAGFQWVRLGPRIYIQFHKHILTRKYYVYQARFLAALLRLLSPNGILYSEDIIKNELQELKTA
jgi:hypothetical protein